MARRYRGVAKKKDNTVKNAAAIVAIVVSLGVLGAIGYWTKARKDEMALLDPATLCPRSGPVAETAVLIDRTDALTEVQAGALRQRIKAWASEVPKYGSFKIYEVGKSGVVLEPVVSVCNPGDGSDASSIDSNPRLLRKRYDDKFEAPIDRMLTSMRIDIEAATSPIMEAVQAISVRDFGPAVSYGPKTLLLVTDLLQHGPEFSLYKNVPNFDAFRKSAYARSVQADLAGVHVSIHLLNRKNAAAKQTDALGEFWIHWLGDQGAIVDEFKRIPG